MARKRGGGLVWSSDGDVCAGCGRPARACACRSRPSSDAGAVVQVGRETKGRRGAGVTVIEGIPLADAELRALAAELKARCGSGGTVKRGRIEIQGDHRDRVLEALAGRGWTLKRAGG